MNYTRLNTLLGQLQRYEDKIDVYRELQSDECMRFIQVCVEEVLRKYPQIEYYRQGMGVWSFYGGGQLIKKIDGIIIGYGIDEVFDAYDEKLHLSGIPLSISIDPLTGEFIITDKW